MELITETLAAGQMKSFRKGGVYFEVLSAPYALAGVNFYSTQGSQINSLRGVPASTFVGFEFGGFDIVNGSAAQTVMLMVADKGETGGTRNIAGSVKVIDQSIDLSAGGLQFLRTIGSTGVAGQYSIAAVVSGARNVAIKTLQIYSQLAGWVSLYYGTGAPTSSPTSLGGLANKRANGAQSLAQTYSAICAAAAPTTIELPGANSAMSINVLAATTFTLQLTSPIFLAAGGATLALVGSQPNSYTALYVDCQEST